MEILDTMDNTKNAESNDEWKDTDDVKPPGSPPQSYTGSTLGHLRKPSGVGIAPVDPLVGSGPPDPNKGEDGSYYLNEITGQVYVKGSGSVRWILTDLKMELSEDQYWISW